VDEGIATGKIEQAFSELLQLLGNEIEDLWGGKIGFAVGIISKIAHENSRTGPCQITKTGIDKA